MEYHKQGKSKRTDRKQSPRYTVMLKIQFIEHYAIIYATKEKYYEMFCELVVFIIVLKIIRAPFVECLPSARHCIDCLH